MEIKFILFVITSDDSLRETAAEAKLTRVIPNPQPPIDLNSSPLFPSIPPAMFVSM